MAQGTDFSKRESVGCLSSCSDPSHKSRIPATSLEQSSQARATGRESSIFKVPSQDSMTPDSHVPSQLDGSIKTALTRTIDCQIDSYRRIEQSLDIPSLPDTSKDHSQPCPSSAYPPTNPPRRTLPTFPSNPSSDPTSSLLSPIDRRGMTTTRGSCWMPMRTPWALSFRRC